MADLFAVQDEVVRTIVGTLIGRVYVSAAERLRRKPPSNPAAYDLTLRGNWLPYDDPASFAEAKCCFEQAIAESGATRTAIPRQGGQQSGEGGQQVTAA